MTRFDIPDMTCGACARRIARALEASGLPPDTGIEIDVAARQVRLPASATPVVAERVRTAITQAGYTAQPAGRESATAGAGGCCCAARHAKAPERNQAGAVPA